MATTVCIEMSDDGQYSVGIEPAESGEEMPMGEDMEQDKSYMTPAESLEDALKMAGEMFSADQRSPDEAVMDGYKKGAKPMMAGKMSPGRVFGDE